MTLSLRKFALAAGCMLFAGQLLAVGDDQLGALDLGVERAALAFERLALGDDVGGFGRLALGWRIAEFGEAGIHGLEARDAFGEQSIGRSGQPPGFVGDPADGGR